MSTTITLNDSDGNALSEHDNLDEAIRAAATLVVHTWPDWERATIRDGELPVLVVSRDGPKGCKRARVAVAGAEYLSHTLEVAHTRPNPPGDEEYGPNGTEWCGKHGQHGSRCKSPIYSPCVFNDNEPEER